MGFYPHFHPVITQRVTSISSLFDERSNKDFSQSNLGGSTSLSSVLQRDVPMSPMETPEIPVHDDTIDQYGCHQGVHPPGMPPTWET